MIKCLCFTIKTNYLLAVAILIHTFLFFSQSFINILLSICFFKACISCLAFRHYIFMLIVLLLVHAIFTGCCSAQKKRRRESTKSI